MGIKLPPVIGYGIIGLLAIVLLWLLVFGGLQTIVCNRLGMEYLASCR